MPGDTRVFVRFKDGTDDTGSRPYLARSWSWRHTYLDDATIVAYALAPDQHGWIDWPHMATPPGLKPADRIAFQTKDDAEKDDAAHYARAGDVGWGPNPREPGASIVRFRRMSEPGARTPRLHPIPPDLAEHLTVNPETPAKSSEVSAPAEMRVSPTGGLKASKMKRPLHLLPFDSLEAIADVLDFGQAKYSARNWERGLSTSDLVRAACGHLWDWFLRRNGGRDPETGLSHLAHAGACIVFLIAHELRSLPDDRPDAVPEVPAPDRTGWPEAQS